MTKIIAILLVNKQLYPIRITLAPESTSIILPVSPSILQLHTAV